MAEFTSGGIPVTDRIRRLIDNLFAEMPQIEADRAVLVTESYKQTENLPIIKTSTKENIGIDIFEEQIKEMFFNGQISFNDEVYITNLRHKEALMDARKSLELVKQSIEDDMPEDFLSIDLMSAYASLGTIIGEEVGEDLVNEIFSKFCMGK